MTLHELGLLVRGTAAVLLDSEQTGEIHVAEELTGRRHYARLRDALFAEGPARELLDARPELRSDQVDYDALRRLPAHTLGHGAEKLVLGQKPLDERSAPASSPPVLDISYHFRVVG